MCARARTFQASLERDFRTDHPNGHHDSVFHAELKTLLTTYYEDLRKVVGASGQEATLVLKHRRSIEPPPASGDNVPPPVLPAGGPPAVVPHRPPPVQPSRPGNQNRSQRRPHLRLPRPAPPGKDPGHGPPGTNKSVCTR
jgi:hypothetical protein